MENVLILLDVDGILITKMSKGFIVKKNAREFIIWCLCQAKVGIYSSMYKKNILKKLSIILSEEEINQLFCIFDRSYTNPDPEGQNKWDTLKDINFVKEIYPNFKKIILCDDSPSKVRYIPNENLVLSEDLEKIKKQLIKKIGFI